MRSKGFSGLRHARSRRLRSIVSFEPVKIGVGAGAPLPAKRGEVRWGAGSQEPGGSRHARHPYPRDEARPRTQARDDLGRAQDMAQAAQPRARRIQVRAAGTDRPCCADLVCRDARLIVRSTAPRIRARKNWPMIKRARPSFVREETASFVSPMPRSTSRRIACSTQSWSHLAMALPDPASLAPLRPAPHLTCPRMRGQGAPALARYDV